MFELITIATAALRSHATTHLRRPLDAAIQTVFEIYVPALPLDLHVLLLAGVG